MQPPVWGVSRCPDPRTPGPHPAQVPRPDPDVPDPDANSHVPDTPPNNPQAVHVYQGEPIDDEDDN